MGEGSVEISKSIGILEIGRASEDGYGVGQLIEFLELDVSVLLKVFSVGLSEEVGDTFESASFVFVLGFPVNLFDLFRFEVSFLFQVFNFCKLFVDVSDPFRNSSKEGFILLVYDLRFFRVVLGLGFLRFFRHWIKNIKLKILNFFEFKLF